MKTVSPKRAPKLPEKLSDCLAVALADLINVERQKDRYSVNMARFHDPIDGQCHVCLAGAVMVGLGVGDQCRTYPDEFTNHNAVRLQAISDTAIQAPIDALVVMGYGPDACFDFEELAQSRPGYYFDPKGFKAGIRKEIKALRKAGL